MLLAAFVYHARASFFSLLGAGMPASDSRASPPPAGQPRIAQVVKRNIEALLHRQRDTDRADRHKITRVRNLLTAVARKLDVAANDPQLAELLQDVRSENVLDTIEQRSARPPAAAS